MKCSMLILGVALFAGSGFAQTEIYIPDNLPAVGTCNAAPFGAASTTYILRFPAATLDPAQRAFDDFAFAPCASNTFNVSTIQIGVGHVPSPLPLPFTFPTFDGGGNVTSLGNLLDYTPVWNSVVQGPFTWMYTANAWSPMGFAALGGTGFVWDGINDVVFYITFQNATGIGSFHRTSTEPFRAYTSGAYQAVASTTTGASGAKVRITVSQAATPATLTLLSPAFIGTTTTVQLSSPGDPGAPYLCGFSTGTVPGIPVGDGRTIPLNFDDLLVFSLTPGNGIFLFTMGFLTPTGDAPVLIVVPNEPALINATVFAAFVVQNPATPTGIGTISPALPITVQ